MTKWISGFLEMGWGERGERKELQRVMKKLGGAVAMFTILIVVVVSHVMYICQNLLNCII